MCVRVLVTGGRDFNDYHFVETVLNEVHRRKTITVLIHGDARGADSLADSWAILHDIPVIACPAEWGKHGKAAGPIRNMEMFNDHNPDLVVAFPGGKGTKHMCDVAESHDCPVLYCETGVPLAI